MADREADACLRRILVDHVRRPFRFLDVACGDATASARALAGTAITHYRGIDLSAAALELARTALAELHCPVTLEHAEDQRPRWTCAPDEWETMTAHVHAADHPETAARWMSLAREAGFATVREAFVAPSDLFRLYWMTPLLASWRDARGRV